MLGLLFGARAVVRESSGTAEHTNRRRSLDWYALQDVSFHCRVKLQLKCSLAYFGVQQPRRRKEGALRVVR